MEDLRNRARWADYEVAIDEMFQRTSTVRRPWIVIPGNSKHYARLAAIDAVVKRLADGVDVAPAGLDPGFEQQGAQATRPPAALRTKRAIASAGRYSTPFNFPRHEFVQCA